MMRNKLQLLQHKTWYSVTFQIRQKLHVAIIEKINLFFFSFINRNNTVTTVLKIDLYNFNTYIIGNARHESLCFI